MKSMRRKLSLSARRPSVVLKKVTSTANEDFMEEFSTIDTSISSAALEKNMRPRTPSIASTFDKSISMDESVEHGYYSSRRPPESIFVNSGESFQGSSDGSDMAGRRRFSVAADYSRSLSLYGRKPRDCEVALMMSEVQDAWKEESSGYETKLAMSHQRSGRTDSVFSRRFNEKQHRDDTDLTSSQDLAPGSLKCWFPYSLHLLKDQLVVSPCPCKQRLAKRLAEADVDAIEWYPISIPENMAPEQSKVPAIDEGDSYFPPATEAPDIEQMIRHGSLILGDPQDNAMTTRFNKPATSSKKSFAFKSKKVRHCKPSSAQTFNEPFWLTDDSDDDSELTMQPMPSRMRARSVPNILHDKSPAFVRYSPMQV